MKDLVCKHCGAVGSLVVRYTGKDPKNRAGSEKKHLDCGFNRPFIYRVRVCRECGATFHSIETFVTWGVKHGDS